MLSLEDSVAVCDTVCACTHAFIPTYMCVPHLMGPFNYHPKDLADLQMHSLMCKVHPLIWG